MGTMGIKLFLFFLGSVFGCTLAFSQAQFSKLERLDPHGLKTLDLKTVILSRQKECQVCHVQKGKKRELKSNIPHRCILCHGKLPHSGAGEHVGKKLSRVQKGAPGEVTCLSCHFPHRAVLTGEERVLEFRELKAHASFLNVKKEEGALPPGLIEKSNVETAMLRTSCTGCHTWK